VDNLPNGIAARTPAYVTNLAITRSGTHAPKRARKHQCAAGLLPQTATQSSI